MTQDDGTSPGHIDPQTPRSASRAREMRKPVAPARHSQVWRLRAAPILAGRRTRATRHTAQLPSVLGTALELRLPLHVLWRVESTAGQRTDMVDDVALA